MGADESIAIIMATYNGERYITEQINSIQQQTTKNWKLYIRDDGSKDDTVALIKDLCRTDPRINLVEDDIGNLGFNLNFYQLLSCTTEKYILFSDQDDFWLPTKIERLIEAIKKAEGTHRKPAIAHSDASVTDENLNITQHRFIGNRGTMGLQGLLIANCVQGSSAIINKELKEIALRHAPKLPFDFHIALLASIYGNRIFIEEPLSLYRHHSSNAIGANKSKASARRGYYTESFLAALGSYQHIKDKFSPLATGAQQAIFNDYICIFEGTSIPKKIAAYMRQRFRFSRRKDYLLMMASLLSKKPLINIYTEQIKIKP
jgi:rhamnosyltransferase